MYKFKSKLAARKFARSLARQGVFAVVRGRSVIA